jgi:hypothetical protein
MRNQRIPLGNVNTSYQQHGATETFEQKKILIRSVFKKDHTEAGPYP